MTDLNARNPVDPGRPLLVWAGLSLLTAMILGTYLRGVLVWAWPLPIRYANAVHAHSHVAYFGWGGLGLMGAAYRLLPMMTGRMLSGGGWLRLQRSLAPVAVAGAFISFGLAGYGGPAIAFSVLNEIVWYLFAVILWLNVRHLPLRRWSAPLVLLAGATLQLVLSTLGTWLLVAAIALGVRTAMVQNAGVYWFLHVYGDGWLVLGAMALVAWLLPRLGGRELPVPAMWWLAGLQVPAALGFLRLLTPLGPSRWAILAGQLGGLVLAAIQVWFLMLVLRAWPRRAGHQRMGPQWGFAGLLIGWLAVLAALEGATLLPGWSDWSLNRQFVLTHLHLKLLGIVSGGLLAWLTAQVARHNGRWRLWLGLYATGVLLMVAALTGAGLFSPTVAWGRFWLGWAFAAGVMVLLGAGALITPAIGRLWARQG